MRYDPYNFQKRFACRGYVLFLVVQSTRTVASWATASVFLVLMDYTPNLLLAITGITFVLIFSSRLSQRRWTHESFF